ncbi:MAG: hypothetical protein KZQ96_21030 [Candidatus Thiodiazotropha sp. (ex Lucinoma borealis)]|nr:hypothetical protein [Candidatus Thiodiazotropha sp. (ex Lucinoma borealis)]
MTNSDKTDLNGAWLGIQEKAVVKTPTCDPEKYREHVEEFDLSEQEQTELLQTLWSIMAAFVDMGFGVDSFQFLPKETLSSAHSDTDEEVPGFKDPNAALPHEKK